MSSIDGLGSLIREIAGVEMERTGDPTEPHGMTAWRSENEKTETGLGWPPSPPFREGTTETYGWIGEQVRRDLTGERMGTNTFVISHA